MWKKKIPTPYRLWDTWGIEQNTYKDLTFSALILGKVGKGWKMEQKIRLADELTVQEDFKKHSVIFFIPYGELDNEASPMLQKTREFVEQATDLGVSSIVAITKLDIISPSFRSKPSEPNKDVENYVNIAARVFNLQQNRILPLLNYVKESQKSFDIDKIVARLLFTAISVANSSFSMTHDNALMDLINS